MVNPRHLVPFFRLQVLVLALLGLSAGYAAMAQAPEPTVESVFAGVPFNKWLAGGPHQQVPWEVRMLAQPLSIHQRLVARVTVQVPGKELVKRNADDHITLLVQVTDQAGATSRNFGRLELTNMSPEIRKSDVTFSWDAFAMPGEYTVDVALYDQVSGEYNLFRGKLRIDPLKNNLLKNDPLQDAWQGLPSFEFWSTKREGLDFVFHSDIEGRLHLPLKTKRPVQLEVLADVSASDIFKGSIASYEQYMGVALPAFKVFSEISVANGSVHLATLDLIQRRVSFTQDDGKDLDWPRLKATLAPTNGPGVVSVSGLKEQRRQNPVFLREELVRRIGAQSAPPSASDDVQAAGVAQKAGAAQKEGPLHVFVLIGSPMDLYAFPDLPPIELGQESNCVLYYLQYEFPIHRRFTAIDFFRQNELPGRGPFARHRAKKDSEDSQVGWGLNGAIGNVQKMLKPMKMHAFKVRSADDLRYALAKVLAEVSEM